MESFSRIFTDLILDPAPLRTALIGCIKRLNVGSYSFRVEIGAVKRPHYGYCVYRAACLAKKLGHGSMSIIEFGVAGGNGLRNLEYQADQTSRALGIDIEIYGFDTGTGLPEPVDYRDLPYHWRKGFYKMDVGALRSELNRSHLILGDVCDTVPRFVDRFDPPPIGALFFDLDYFSSTQRALELLNSDSSRFLPRIHCYFDDVLGGELELYNDYTGQRASIKEFNDAHRDVKLASAYHLLTRRLVEVWYHKIWIGHFFTHPDYNTFIGTEDQQLVIR